MSKTEKFDGLTREEAIAKMKALEESIAETKTVLAALQKQNIAVSNLDSQCKTIPETIAEAKRLLGIR